MNALLPFIKAWGGQPKPQGGIPLPEVSDPEVIASEDRLRRLLDRRTKTNFTGGLKPARMTMPTLVGVA
jgi:hypothetical protein